MNIYVITSYSIHYTKLYDTLVHQVVKQVVMRYMLNQFFKHNHFINIR